MCVLNVYIDLPVRVWEAAPPAGAESGTLGAAGEPA